MISGSNFFSSAYATTLSSQRSTFLSSFVNTGTVASYRFMAPDATASESRPQRDLPRLERGRANRLARRKVLACRRADSRRTSTQLPGAPGGHDGALARPGRDADGDRAR